jgi:mRNA degradation ribonuclease J1/J2
MEHNGKGRIISTQFASNLHRLATMKHAADATGRKLAYAGQSFFTYLTAAHKAGRAPFDPSELLELQTALDGYPAEKLLVLTTGSQGEPFAALNLAAHGASPVLTLERSDLLLYSAKVIPGNQKRVARLFNKVAEWGPEVASGPTARIQGGAEADTQDGEPAELPTGARGVQLPARARRPGEAALRGQQHDGNP